MLGAPSGAVGAANGPQSGSESRISSSILPLNSVTIAGLTLVVDPRDFGCRLHRCAQWSANIALTNDHVANPRLRTVFACLGVRLHRPPSGPCFPYRRARRASLIDVAVPADSAADYLALSRISTSRQRFVADSGRVSSSETRSPIPAMLFSSCALTFVVVRMILPYSGCRMRFSSSTTMVFCILSLTTKPIRVLRRPRGFGVLGVRLGPLALPAVSFAAAAFGAALAGAFFAGVFASDITSPRFQHHWGPRPGRVHRHVARCRRVRSPGAPCGVDDCC